MDIKFTIEQFDSAVWNANTQICTNTNKNFTLNLNKKINKL